jgi:predicted nucleic acid-binding protein
MTVVANTSPPNYLVQIGAIDLLPALFRRVTVPPAVLAELRHDGAPELVRQWADAPPAWLEVRPSTNPRLQLNLGPGELEAITLALELRADVILIDDRRARHVAADLKLNVIGTLAVLVEAKQKGLIDLDQAVARLTATSFRIHPSVLTNLRGP